MSSIYIIHGWTTKEQSEKLWQPLIQLLERSGLRVKFLRVPGLLAPLDEVWQLQNYVDWLEKEIEEGKAILLGHSFGGQIAIRFTAQHPDRVERLILLGNSSIRDRRLLKRIKRAAFFTLAKLGKPFVKIDPLRRLFYKSIREVDYLEAPPLLRKTMANVLREEILADLERIKPPTLIIWGKRDKTVPVNHAYLESEKIKNSSLAVIEDGRHSPQFTHTIQVADLIADFLKQE
ncbi:MAG: alpha/beta hydrolase [Candidatus Colwellbacteria bacterium]|nr:alpha/beta hydrolase [Candidatus Colwellbacteria bacterium]